MRLSHFSAFFWRNHQTMAAYLLERFAGTYSFIPLGIVCSVSGHSQLRGWVVLDLVSLCGNLASTFRRKRNGDQNLKDAKARESSREMRSTFVLCLGTFTRDKNLRTRSVWRESGLGLCQMTLNLTILQGHNLRHFCYPPVSKTQFISS